MFEEQFTSSRSGFIYRYKSKGAGFRLTKTQRDEFIDAGRQGVRWAICGPLLLVFPFAALLVRIIEEAPGTTGMPLGWLIAILLMALLTAFLTHRTWQGPLQNLRNVAPDFPPLTAREAKRRFYSKRPYWLLAAFPIFLLALVVGRLGFTWPDGNEKWLLLIPLGGVIMATWMIWAKWKSEQRS